MPERHLFHTGAALALCLKELFRQLEERLLLRSRVSLGLTTADEIEHRATSALGGYVDGLAMLRLNLRDAPALARQVEAQRSDAA